MRVQLPLLRTRYRVRPARASILRYGVAALSIAPALIPAFLFRYLIKQSDRPIEANNALPSQLSTSHPGPTPSLLTDVSMPGTSGRQLARRIFSSQPEASELDKSDYTESAIGHNGPLEPGTNLLHRPLALPTLKAEMWDVLNKPSLRRSIWLLAL